MDIKGLIAIIVSFGIALGLLWVIDTYVTKTPFDLFQESIKIIIVLAIVLVAGWLTKKTLHKEGIDVKIDGH